MRQSKTTLKELTAAYRAVLRYGILCNAVALGLAVAPAVAGTSDIDPAKVTTSYNAAVVWSGVPSAELVADPSINPYMVSYGMDTNNNVTVDIRGWQNSGFGAFTNYFGRAGRGEANEHSALSGLTMKDSSLLGNTGTFVGGGMSLWTDGRAVGESVEDTWYPDDKVPEPFTNTIVNSEFGGNTANAGGGLALLAWMDNISQGKTVLDNVSFVGNSATETNAGVVGNNHGGGAILIKNNNKLTATNTTFGGATSESGNTSATDGGAIRNLATGEIELNGTNTFDHNSAVNGGAIANEGTLTVTPVDDAVTTFANNTATNQGGAVAQLKGAESPWTGVEFNNNSAKLGGAAFARGIFDVKDSSFTGNTSEQGGGAIYLGTLKGGHELTIDNTTFENNSTQGIGNAKDGGGAIGSFSQLIVKNGSSFTNNRVTDAVSDGGGALFMGSVSDNQISDATFTSNTSASTGGAIATRHFDKGDNKDATLDIASSTFASNIATTDGGAIYNTFYNDANNDGYVKVTGSTFNTNSADRGGAIFNTVGKEGEVLSSGQQQIGKMYISDSNFTGNIAKTDGAAIYNEGVVTVAANNANVAFSGNKVGDETDGYTNNDIYNAGTLNLAAADGKTISLAGGINGENGTLNVDGAGNVSVAGLANQNTTVATGATLNLSGAVSDSTIANNATTSLNDVTMSGSHINNVGTLTGNATFANNTGATQGGALYNTGTANVTGTFEGNTAASGGAIFNKGTLTLGNGTTFLNNDLVSDAGDGADIYNNGGSITIGDNLTVTHEGDPVGDCDIYSDNGGYLKIGDNASFTGGGDAIVTTGPSASRATLIVGDGANFENFDDAAIIAWSNTDATIGKNATFDNTGLAIQNSRKSVTTVDDGFVVKNAGNERWGAILNRADDGGDDRTKLTFLGSATIKDNSNHGLYNRLGAITTFDGETLFQNNNATAVGGAIRNVDNAGGYNSTVVFNSAVDFDGNTSVANGGAIYNEGVVTFNDNATFSGNKSNVVRDGEGNITSSADNDIYNTGTLNFSAADGKAISLAGGIDGLAGALNVNGAGDVTIAGALKNQTTTVSDGSLTLNDVDLTGTTLSNAANTTVNAATRSSAFGTAVVNSGTLALNAATDQSIVVDAGINNGTAENAGTVTLNGTGTVSIEDLANQSVTINAGTLNLSGDIDTSSIVNNADANLSVAGVNFDGSRVVNWGTMTGGSVDGEGNLLTSAGTFENRSAVNGGAIHNRGDLTLHGATFQNNTASNQAGAIYGAGNVTLTNATVSGNSAYTSGAIRTFQDVDSTLTIADSTFTGNHAVENGAIAIMDKSGKSTITDSTFSGNYATFNNMEEYDTAYEGGGALSLGSESLVEVSGTTFTNNYTTLHGGAISTRTTAQSNGAETLDIVNSTFTGNKAGVLYDAEHATTTASAFAETHGFGGAIYANVWHDNHEHDYATIDNSTFSSNAAYAGGAVYNDAVDGKVGALRISDSSFTGNTATSAGGALYNKGVMTVVAESANVAFDGNTAAGDANDIYNAGTLTLNAAEGQAISLAGGINGENGTLNVDGAGDVTIANALQNQATTVSGNLTLNNVDMTGSTFANSGAMSVNATNADSMLAAVTNTGTLTLNAAGQTMTVSNGIANNTENKGTVDITAGTVNLTSAMANQNATVYGGELQLADGSSVNGSAITVKSGATINTIDNAINDYSDIVTLLTGANIKGDLDYDAGLADTYSAAAGANVTYRLANALTDVDTIYSNEEKLVSVVNDGATVNVDLEQWYMNKDHGLNLTSSGNADGKVKLKGTDTGGINNAVDVTVDTLTQEVTYSLTTDETFDGSDNTIEKAEFAIVGNTTESDEGAKLTLANNLVVDETSTLSITNANLAQANDTETIQNVGNLNIKDSLMRVAINNSGILVSDPTYYGAQVVNSGTASFDGDIFESTSSLVNSATVNLKDTTFIAGSTITNTGTINLAGGTTTFNNDVDGLALVGTGGNLNLQNDKIDSLGALTANSSVGVSVDANLTAGTSDSFASLTGAEGVVVNGINVAESQYNDTGAVQRLALLGDGTTDYTGKLSVSSDADINVAGTNYFTNVFADNNGNIVFGDKLMNTSGMHTQLGDWGNGVSTNYIGASTAYDAETGSYSTTTGTTVGAALTALDTQVKTNADNFAGLAVANTGSLVDGSNITDGTIALSALSSGVQASLGKADSAVQSVASGSANGTISVDGTDVAVTGLGSAAYTDANAYATAAQGALADTALQASALINTALTGTTTAEALKVGGYDVLTTNSALNGANLTDGTVALSALSSDVQASLGKADSAVQSVASGSANGTISVDGTDVAVTGLGSAAYTDANAYATAAQGATADATAATIATYGDVVTHNAADFATAAQGALADTALQASALNNTHLTGNTVIDTLNAGATTVDSLAVDGTSYGITSAGAASFSTVDAATVNATNLTVGSTTVSGITQSSAIPSVLAALSANPSTYDVAAGDQKLITEAAVVAGISSLMSEKQAWLNDEFGYNTNSTDADTVLREAGFADQNDDNNVGFYDAVVQNKNNIGTMSGLTTTEKGSLVGAINELDSDIAAVDAKFTNGTVAANFASVQTSGNATIGGDLAVAGDANVTGSVTAPTVNTDNLKLGATTVSGITTSATNMAALVLNPTSATDTTLTTTAAVAAADNYVLNTSMAYTDAKLKQINAYTDERVDKLDKNLSSGIASAIALTSVSASGVQKGEVAVSGGYGYYNGQSAAAFGAAMGLSNRWSVNAGAGVSNSDVSFRAGTTYKFKAF